MDQSWARPWIKQRFDSEIAGCWREGEDAAVILSRTLRTWGESESGLNERLDPLIARLDEVGNPTLAFNASGWEGIKIRLTAKAATEAPKNMLTRRLSSVG